MNRIEKLQQQAQNVMFVTQRILKPQETTKTFEDGVTINLKIVTDMETLDRALLNRYAKLHHSKYIILKSEITKHNTLNHDTKRQSRPTVAYVKGSKEYEIKAHEKYGLSCNCPSWKYNQRGDRTCKHTDKVEQHITII